MNLNGELIGINSAILSKDGGNIGIGFAIPVNMVKAVMEQLITYGEVKRGLVGIKLRDVTPEAAESLQLVNARGVEIPRWRRALPPITPASKSPMWRFR